MKTVLKTILALLLFAGAEGTYAQAPTLSLTNIKGISATNWKYGTVTCVSTNNITSITISMINNNIVGNNSGITPQGTFSSTGFNPRTVTYVFTGISSGQVQSFIGGITFGKTTEIAGANNSVTISVDANPTSLPPGATITAWENHPDGSPHYYVWVDKDKYIAHNEAYNEAKSYYFQGMRGYLPTITSDTENALLTNISTLGGWSGGARTTVAVNDAEALAVNTGPSGSDFKWLCGPETNFAYCRTQAGIRGSSSLDNAYSGWPLAASQPDGTAGIGGFESGEYAMQINYGGFWNDLPETAALLGGSTTPDDPSAKAVLRGYFIEFGGSGKAYSVNGANYPANPKYVKPTTGVTTNDQWYGFSPGNTSSAATTIKANNLRSNMMVIE